MDIQGEGGLHLRVKSLRLGEVKPGAEERRAEVEHLSDELNVFAYFDGYTRLGGILQIEECSIRM